jgi:opacity protein-like surface antigen
MLVVSRCASQLLSRLALQTFCPRLGLFLNLKYVYAVKSFTNLYKLRRNFSSDLGLRILRAFGSIVSKEDSYFMCKTLWQAWLAASIIYFAFCPPMAAQDAPRVELFGSYSYVHFDSFTLGFNDFSGLNGGNAGFTFNVTPHIGVVGEIGEAWSSPFKLYDGLVGPRYSYRRGRLSIFGQGLLGKAKTHVEIPTAVNGGQSSSGFAFAGCGGLDYSVTNHFSVRVAQVDYLRTKMFQVEQRNLRFSAGIIYHIGRVRSHKRPKLTP